MITMVFSNVSSSKLNCMRRQCRAMMRHHAAMNGYTMSQMSFPPGNRATWYCRMHKSGKMKEMMMRVYRDPMTSKVMMQCSQDMMSDSAMRQMMRDMYNNC